MTDRPTMTGVLTLQQPERGGHHGARREAGEDALLPSEPASHGDGLVIGDGEMAVDRNPVEERELRHGVATALDAVGGVRDRGAGKGCGLGRLQHVAADVGIASGERTRHAGVRAAGADELDEGVETPLAL